MKPKPIGSQWTDEQWDAISIRGCNVLVSAGAGSGKTAVLSERVLELVREGVDVTDLIVLTFTNAAAAEMKERIRNKLLADGATNPQVLASANKIDQSFITTFDSFCLYLVKKYNYMLNVSQNIKIIDNITASIEKERLMLEVLERFVQANDLSVIDFITTYSATSITEISSILLSFYNSSIQNIEPFALREPSQTFELYEVYVQSIFTEIKQLTGEIEKYASETNLPEKIGERLSLLLNSKSYDEIHQTVEVVFETRFWQLPRKNFDNKDFVKELNDRLKTKLKELRAATDKTRTYQIELLANNNQVKLTINRVLTEFEQQFSELKQTSGLFEFIDINLMAIKLLEANPQICAQYRERIYEIMIDEYQDTNDIQEKFVNLIANDNVYMVGDIKQSIYGFRNANPKLFASKFNNYASGNGGKLITLTSNFRSRAAVLDQVNNFFGQVMSDDFGGITYDQTQVMKYGNRSYDLLADTNDNEIITYDSDSLDIDRSDFEIMQIFKDIQHKLSCGYQVVDSKGARSVRLSDFAIICATREKFERIVQIGEFYHISVNADIQERFSASEEITVIQSIFNILNIIKKGNDDECKLLFSIVQLARSYIFDFTDQEIDEGVSKLQKIKESEVSKRIYALEFGPLAKIASLIKGVGANVDLKSNSYILEQSLVEFKVIDRLMGLHNPQVRQLRLTKICELIADYDSRNYSLEQICTILNDIEKNADLDIEFGSKLDLETDSVNVITIHKSKGLEYNICYFPFLFKKFNSMDLNSRFAYSHQSEYIFPSVLSSGNLTNTVEKLLFNDAGKRDLISEKIRLFYVAITRAKDKNILIVDTNRLDNEKFKPVSSANTTEDLLFNGWRALKQYCKPALTLSEDEQNASVYNKFNQVQPSGSIKLQPLEYRTVEYPLKSSETRRASGHISDFVSSQVAANIERGNEVHEQLEFCNLFKLEEELERAEGTLKIALTNLKASELLGAMINYYTEFQFKSIDEYETNGIIDLLVETEDKFIVIDYKLNNIDKPEYEGQVTTYVNYIQTMSSKKVEGYLLSLISGAVKRVL